MLKLFSSRKSVKIEQEISSIQAGDEQLRNQLLQEYRPFIKKSVSKVCKRYVTESDDEFSIGLIAFNHAIDQYATEKGSSFLSFANIIIQRRVIDFIRKHNKVQSVSIDDYELDEDQPQSSIVSAMSMKEYERQKEAGQRRSEILALTSILADYNLTFQDLIEQTPKHKDAKQNAMLIAKTLTEHRGILGELHKNKKLPIKELTEIVNVSRKTIERNRKYIIGMTIILTGDFPYLRDYIKEVVEQ